MTRVKNDKISNLGKLLENSLLMEGELERAELVLAMKDIVSRMQKMLEDAGKMATDDIMPLSDGLRTYYGETVSNKFTSEAEAALQQMADSIQTMKDLFDNQSAELEQHISDEDAEKPISDMTDVDMSSEPGEDNVDDEFNAALDGDDSEVATDIGDETGSEAPELDVEAPLGRAKKEGYTVMVNGKAIQINEQQYKILQAARKITGEMNRVAMEDIPVDKVKNAITENTLIVNICNKKVKVTETQAKSLLFAKKLYEKTSLLGARNIRLSESQNTMLENAKKIMNKLSSVTKKK